MKHCLKCKVEYADDVIFCSHCGQKVLEGKLPFPCPKCGQVLETNDEQFCPHCGQKLNSVQSTVDTTDKKIYKKYVLISAVIVVLLGGGYFSFKQHLINEGFIAPNTSEEQYKYSKHLSQKNMHGVSKEWLIKSAENGHPAAQFEYAKILISEGYMWEKSFDLLTKSAQNGNSEAQYLLGQIYYDGYLPVTARKFNTDKYIHLKNEQLAFMWYEKAAKQGHYEAQKKVGVCYEFGTVVPQDYEKAFYWYKKLADKEDSYFKNIVALWTFLGKGTPKDTKAAFKLWDELIEKNYTGAMWSLAELYQHGYDDIAKDPHKAIKLYERSLEHGATFAYTYIGHIYYNDPSVKNIDKAIEYFKLGAKAGDDNAVFFLIEYYEKIGNHAEAFRMKQLLSN